MTKYFAKGTPLAGLERMMMRVPGFQPEAPASDPSTDSAIGRKIWTADIACITGGEAAAFPLVPISLNGWKAEQLDTGNWCWRAMAQSPMPLSSTEFGL